MNSISTLDNKIQQYKNQAEVVKKNRTFWASILKKTLITELQYLVNNLKVDWQVSENNDWVNMQSVALSIPIAPSGIYEETPKSVTNFIKYGGYLLFSQTTNGRIVVVIVYPYIEKLTSHKPHKVVGFYDPEKLDVEFIRTRVGEFLDEMIDWEINKDPEDDQDNLTPLNYAPIGFRLKGQAELDI